MTLQASQANSPTYTRPKPPEWDRLHEVAGIVTGLQDSQWDKPVLLSELGHEITPLSETALVNNKYYALGNIICNFAKEVQKPDVRREIVAAGARQLISFSAMRQGGISALSALPGFDLSDPFSDVFDKAYATTSTDTRLVANYLSVVYGIAFNNPDINPASEQVTNIVAVQMRGDSTSSARRALDSVTVSPPYVLKKILSSRGVDIIGGEVPCQDQIQKLRHDSVSKVAKRLCVLTSAQSLGHDGDVITVDEHEVGFTPPRHPKATVFSRLRQSRPMPISHKDVMSVPMVCPALHAGAAIPMVMEMTVDMIDEARRMLDE